MPIYEFYCAECHTVFSFLSRAVDTSRRPSCPRCGKPDLERQASRFAVSRAARGQEARGEGGDDAVPPGMDEERMERAMASLADEAEGLNEDDPRQMARLMRKLYSSTGLRLGDGMEEAIRRMEAGEDPEKIEEEMGDLMEQEDPLLPAGDDARGRLKRLRARLRRPAVDDTLYEL
jgi:putative FmdB family regulatory protein